MLNKIHAYLSCLSYSLHPRTSFWCLFSQQDLRQFGRMESRTNDEADLKKKKKNLTGRENETRVKGAGSIS